MKLAPIFPRVRDAMCPITIQVGVCVKKSGKQNIAQEGGDER